MYRTYEINTKSSTKNNAKQIRDGQLFSISYVSRIFFVCFSSETESFVYVSFFVRVVMYLSRVVKFLKIARLFAIPCSSISNNAPRRANCNSIKIRQSILKIFQLNGKAEWCTTTKRNSSFPLLWSIWKLGVERREDRNVLQIVARMRKP